MVHVIVQEAWLVVNQMYASLTAKCAGIQFGRTDGRTVGHDFHLECRADRLRIHRQRYSDCNAMSRSGRAASDVPTARSLGM